MEVVGGLNNAKFLRNSIPDLDIRTPTHTRPYPAVVIGQSTPSLYLSSLFAPVPALVYAFIELFPSDVSSFAFSYPC